MSEIQISTTGHLTRDPELTYTPSGQGVAKFQVAVTPRKKLGDQWVDGDTTFLACEAWGDLGEHIAESLSRGTQVFVQGVLRTQRWDDKTTGEKRERLFVRVDEIGPSLRFANAKVTKATRITPSDTDEYARKVQTVREQLGGQVTREDNAPY